MKYICSKYGVLSAIAVLSIALFLGACATEKKIELTPTPVTQSAQAQEEELPQDITWTTVVAEDRTFSISVPSEWETNFDVEELSAEFPAFIENGIVPFLVSIDTKTGSSLIILMDVQYLFEEEPIDVEEYIQSQIEDLKLNPAVSGMSTHAITIDGIMGTQVRFTMMEDASAQTNILIGNEDEVRMLCGHLAMVVQGIYSSDAQLSVLGETIESLRILPTAAGSLESC